MDAEAHPEIDRHVLLEVVSPEVQTERVPEFPGFHLLEFPFGGDGIHERVRDLFPKPAPKLDLEARAVEAFFGIPAKDLVWDADQIGKV